MGSFSHERCVVFLDPDTGLEPEKSKGDEKHVLNREAQTFWRALPGGTVFAFYQHKPNRSNDPWIEPKRAQLEAAIGIAASEIGVASGIKIANDVVLFYAVKP